MSEVESETKQISEAELSRDEANACTNCPDYEGAIWLCGEGYLCERCFAVLADLEEEKIVEDVEMINDEHRQKVRASLSVVRDGES